MFGLGRLFRGGKNKQANRRRQRGLTLMEVAITLIIIAGATAQMAMMSQKNAAAIKSKATAQKMVEVVNATKSYVTANYSDLVSAVGTSPVVIPLTSGTGPGGLPNLRAGGFLPSTFENRNPYNKEHVILVKNPGGNELEVLITTRGGTDIPDSELGSIAASVGAQGGFMLQNPVGTAGPNDIVGSFGGWRSSVSAWNAGANTPSAGNLMATIGFESGSVLSDYLYRYDMGDPEGNTMRTNLSMSGNSIRDVEEIEGASSAARVLRLARDVEVARDVTVGRHLDVSNNATIGNNMQVGSNLTVDGDATIDQDLDVGGAADISGALSVSSTISATGNISGRDISGRDFAASRHITANNNITAGNNLRSSNDVIADRHVLANNNITATTGNIVASSGNITASNGNITANNGTIRGRDLRANRDLQVDRHVTVTGNATVGGDVRGHDVIIDGLGGTEMSRGIYWAGVVRVNTTSAGNRVPKPVCPPGMAPKVYVTPTRYSDNGNGRYILHVSTYALDQGSFYTGMIRLTVPNAAGTGVVHVDVDSAHGEVLAFTKCGDPI